jgi:small subunit ribosomal protein S17
MTGIVASNKMEKCLVVWVYARKRHPKYGKYVRARKKYFVSCEDPKQFPVNSKVDIEACTPISKNIKWKVKN